jgi:hypothetical protein
MHFMENYSIQGRKYMYFGADNVSGEPVAPIFRVAKFVIPT